MESYIKFLLLKYLKFIIAIAVSTMHRTIATDTQFSGDPSLFGV